MRATARKVLLSHVEGTNARFAVTCSFRFSVVVFTVLVVASATAAQDRIWRRLRPLGTPGATREVRPVAPPLDPFNMSVPIAPSELTVHASDTFTSELAGRLQYNGRGPVEYMQIVDGSQGRRSAYFYIYQGGKVHIAVTSYHDPVVPSARPATRGEVAFLIKALRGDRHKPSNENLDAFREGALNLLRARRSEDREQRRTSARARPEPRTRSSARRR